MLNAVIEEVEEVKEVSLIIEGMHCPSCAAGIEYALRATPGVLSARVSFTTGRAVITYDSSKISLEEIKEIIRKIGYEIVEEEEREGRVVSGTKITLILLGVICSSAIAYLKFFTHLAVKDLLMLALATPVQLLTGAHFYKGAYNAIRNRLLDMNVLVVLSTSSAYTYSVLATLVSAGATFFECSALTVTIITIGMTLEEAARKRAGEAIRKLLELQPDIVRVLRPPEEPIEIEVLHDPGCPHLDSALEEISKAVELLELKGRVKITVSERPGPLPHHNSGGRGHRARGRGGRLPGLCGV